MLPQLVDGVLSKGPVVQKYQTGGQAGRHQEIDCHISSAAEYAVFIATAQGNLPLVRDFTKRNWY